MDNKQNKGPQYHNVSVRHYHEYHTPDEFFEKGQRFRIIGQFDGKKIDTWATVRRADGDGYVGIEYIGEYGGVYQKNLDRTTMMAMLRDGQKREAERIALESAIAWQASQEGLVPKHEPSILQKMLTNGMINVGDNLTIDGVDYGTITDCAHNDGVILVKTNGNQFLFTSVNVSNEYNKINNPCYFKDDALLKMQSTEPIDKQNVINFIISHHEELPLSAHSNDSGVHGSQMLDDMVNNDVFIRGVGLRIADYMKKNQITDVVHTSNKTIINDLLNMVKCEMVDHGYAKVEKDRPSQQAIAYLQSIGYSESAMAEKAEIMSRWLADKDLNYKEYAVARSIAEGKVLHVLQDIDRNSIKFKLFQKFDFKWEDAIHVAMNNECRFIATHMNLALGTKEHGMVKMPEVDFDLRESLGDFKGDLQICSNEKDMYVSFDVSEEYHKFGGFDYNRALEQSQEITKDDPEIDEIEMP